MTVWAGGSGSNPHYVGLNLWVSGVTVYWEVRVRATYSVSDSQNYTVWGAVSQSGTYNMNGPGERVVASGNFNGNRGQNYGFGARIGDVYGNNNNVPDVYANVTVPAIAPAPPTFGPQPYQVLNQTQVRLNWGPTSNNNGANPTLDGLIVRRVSDGVDVHGSEASGSIRDVYGLTPNTTYTAFARIWNGAGWSGWTQGTTWSTPPDLPAAPTNASVSRNSDNSHTITWTNNSTSGAPYQAIRVDRWDNVSNVWTVVTNPGGAPTSFTDTTTVADRRYQWRVHAGNTAGASGFSYTAPGHGITTTPTAPTDVTATKVNTSDIRVAWTNTSTYGSDVQVWHAANGVWDASPLTTIGYGTVAFYVHPSPLASATHTYRVRAVSDIPVLYSAYSTSNVVQLLTPPNAPSTVAPTTPQDATLPITLSWIHNSVDTSPQTKKQIRYRLQGASTWTTPAAVSNSTPTWVIAANTWTNGVTVEWQVMTWGDHATGSPWSSSGVFTASRPPLATLLTPTAGSHVSPRVNVTWAYSDPEGQVQSGWEIQLLNAQSVVVETKTGSGTATSYLLDTSVPDRSTWTIRVRVRDSSGLWSTNWSSATITVSYPAPPTPIVSAEWKESDGVAEVSVENPLPAQGTRLLTNLATNPKLTNTYGTTAVPAIATNYARNPRALNSSFGVYNLGAGEAGTTSYLTGQSDGPPGTGITSYGRQLVTTAKTGGSSGWNALGTAQRDPLVGVAGDIVTGSIWFRYTGPGTLSGTMRTEVKVDATAVTQANEPFTAPSGVWVRLSATVVATGAYNAVSFWNYQTSGWTAPVGSTIDVTGSMYELASTPSEYFDGATSNVNPFAYTWSGTANNSASAKRWAAAASGTAPTPRALSGSGLNTSVPMTAGGQSSAYVEGNYAVVSANPGAINTGVALYPDRGTTTSGDAMRRSNMVPGKTYAIGVLYSQEAVHTGPFSGGDPLRAISTTLRTSASANLWNQVRSNSAPNEVQTDTLLTVAFTIPADAVDYGIRLITGTIGVLDRGKFRNLIICEGVNAADALSKVTRYFDGDTAQDSVEGGYTATHSWTGTPNASTSTASLTPAPATVRNDFYRKIGNGDWELIQSNVPTNSSIVDYTVPVTGDVWYRALAWSALPSTSTSNEAKLIFSNTCAVSSWISGGPGFSIVRKASYDITISEKFGLSDKTLHRFAGRLFPVEFSGEGREHTVGLTWAILPDSAGEPYLSTVSGWDDIFYLPGPHLYRDGHGRIFYCSISDLSLSNGRSGATEASVTLTEISKP